MIDSSKCVTVEGRTFCYDADTRKVAEVKVIVTPIERVPPKALQMLIELLAEGCNNGTA